MIELTKDKMSNLVSLWYGVGKPAKLFLVEFFLCKFQVPAMHVYAFVQVLDVPAFTMRIFDHTIRRGWVGGIVSCRCRPSHVTSWRSSFIVLLSDYRYFSIIREQ